MRRSNRKRRRLLGICAVLTVAALLLTGCAGQSETDPKSASAETASERETEQGQETAVGDLAGTESLPGGTESLPAATESPRDTPAETGTEETSASMAVENEKIDPAGLDTTPEGWGMGREYDAYHRPEFCLIYQERYKDYPVYFIGPWEEGDPQVIYLTLNMGWSNKWVNLSLDTLQEKGVQAVFFSTGNVLWENPETIERVITEGHDLGNHTMHHKMDGMPSLSVEQQEAEIMDMHRMALEDFGYEMHLFRFPNGEFNEQSLAIVNNCNYKSVFWSYTYVDWNRSDQPDVAASVRDAVDHLHPGAIYCFHATSETSATMLGAFIDQVREKGYEFQLLR